MAIDDKAEQLKHLVAIGRARGYVLYDEIDEFLPAGDERPAVLEDVLSELARNRIEVVEEPKTTKSDDAFGGDNEFLSLDPENDPLHMYLRELRSTPHLTREQEIELGKRISRRGADCEDAMRQLIEANLRLVVATARRYANHGLAMLDLVEEGNKGLMNAVETFDSARGYRFSTYAIWWVRQAIMRSISQQQ